MKKTLYILPALIFLLGCSDDIAVTEIRSYVNDVNGQKDLIESITELTEKELEDGPFDKYKIYELRDGKGFTCKIIELREDSSMLYNYEFYYKNDTVNYARIIQIDKTENDTIIASEYFYKSEDLLHQLHKRREYTDAEIVRQLSVFVWYYLKQRNDENGV